ncbi:porin [Neptuniibacter caesariensis]|uniref:OmpH porin-like protein H n=1 Tax=Neptuniibacter caesariensis TaxID=207954 RepID=A0A7U8C634_NEPCE|nr:porin [Neptuniibacter caesariensis]EAR60770.1 OmpH porin-like protein H precursor [Neptuniibacter caesariensis]
MKKLALALAVSATLAANSSVAATIYSGDGLTYKLKGDWQVQLRDDYKKSTDADVEFDDLELKNTVIYDLGNGLQAFGQLDYSFNSEADDTSSDSGHLEEAYLGVQYDNIKVKVGKTNTAGDEFGVEKAYETILEQDQFDVVKSSGDDLIRIEADFEAASVVFSHEISSDGNSSANGEATDLFVSTSFDAVSLAAAYQTHQANASSYDDDTWGLSASFDAGFAKFGADYSSTDYGNPATADADITNLVATFAANEQTKVALGYVMVDSDAANEDSDAWYANVTYKFPSQKNVSVFAEVSQADFENAADDAASEVDILAGMQIKF